MQNCTALTVQTGFKTSPWGCHLQRGAQPQAAGKSLLLCAGFPRLSPVFGAIYYKQRSEVAACPSRPRRRARSPRPAGSARSGASHRVAYLGGKSAGGGGGGRSSVRSGGPARSSGHRGAGAIPGEAGVRGCHTGSTATTPPAQHAARPRHSEHRARAAPGSSAQRDQILTRFLPRPRH